MEIFDSTILPNYQVVKKMGPAWLAEFREIDANYQYAGWTLDLIAFFLNKLVLNEFPMHCDLETLSMLEVLLSVEYWGEVTEEERRKTVSAYFAGSGKLSKTAIEGLVNLYTGQKSDVRWDGEVLIIDFDNTSTVDIAMAALLNILLRRMPAHIDFRLRAMCKLNVGIRPTRTAWPNRFTPSGIIPGVNIGLGMVIPELDLKPSGIGYIVKNLMSGVTAGDSGTYPMTNIAYDENEEGLISEISAQGYRTEYLLCGEEVYNC